jgi:hypothetical protein
MISEVTRSGVRGHLEWLVFPVLWPQPTVRTTERVALPVGRISPAALDVLLDSLW